MSTNPAQSDAPLDDEAGTPAVRARARRRSKQRRRAANVAGLLVGLLLTGVLYSLFAPANAAEDEGSVSHVQRFSDSRHARADEPRIESRAR